MLSYPLCLQRNVFTTLTLVSVLGGCSTPAPEAWRVAPIFQVAHAGTDHGYQALARQYEGEHRWREARDAWRKAALAAPQDADTLNALGMAEAGQGLYGKAVEALRRAVALAPQSAQLLNNLGYALLLNGDPEEARIVLKEALLRKPDHLLAMANLHRLEQLAQNMGPPTSQPTDAPVKPDVAAPRMAPPSSPAVEAPLSPREPSTPAPNLQSVPNVAPFSMRQTGLAAAETATPAPAAAAPTPTLHTVPALQPRIEIANGNGINGMATALRGWLRTRGLEQKPLLRNALPFNTATTVVHYRVGYFEAAQALAERMPQRVTLATEPGGVADVDVRVVLGRDFLKEMLSFL
ncbi:MAG: LytR C-terminal domain-containing protein [Rhodoferax sp.]|nr:LytR C-terminal domain-containing protein [Rhodoferax sp.]MDP3653122.1 LytR C-terminal domain-containing protein [Rhodoferax sp.]